MLEVLLVRWILDIIPIISDKQYKISHYNAPLERWSKTEENDILSVEISRRTKKLLGLNRFQA